jgi:TRAP-type C4-dicarboxylate transport system permease small subunit
MSDLEQSPEATVGVPRRPGLLGVICVAIAGATVWYTAVAYLIAGVSRQLGLPEIPHMGEFIGYGLAIVIAFGTAATQAFGRHAEIDFVSSRLPPTARRIHAFVSNMAGVAAGVVLSVGTLQFAMNSF